MKASIYDVETLVQVAKAYQAEEKINYEISALQEAFKRVQATKKVNYCSPALLHPKALTWADCHLCHLCVKLLSCDTGSRGHDDWRWCQGIVIRG
jgi:hypothetical protein